ncbi:hypothetical protein DFAR_3060024 [Desulfarculales bacterium]
MAYARIDEGFWTDPLIKGLSPEGKLIAAWLFTNPHRHFSGIYYLPTVLIQVEIGVSIGVSEKVIKSLEEQGFIKYSPEFSVVWVIKMLKHQAGVNSQNGKLSPQQVKGIEKQLATLHGCPLIVDFIEHYKHFKIKYDTPIDTPIDIKKQSQSQKQKQDKELIAPPGTIVPADAAPASHPFFVCPYFVVDLEYRLKLAKEYPAMADNLLLVELSKMEDWISDNAQKKKFKANGHLANPKLFIKNWLNKIDDIKGPGSDKPKGFAVVKNWVPKGA